MTKDGDHLLKVQFSDWKDESESVAMPFSVGDEDTKYALHIQPADTMGSLESSLATISRVTPTVPNTSLVSGHTNPSVER